MSADMRELVEAIAFDVVRFDMEYIGCPSEVIRNEIKKASDADLLKWLDTL